MNPADLPDEVLVAKVQGAVAAESEAAFVELMRRHDPVLLAFLSKPHVLGLEASDLSQDVWFRVWRRLTDPGPGWRFDPARSTFRHYLMQVARHLAVDYARRRSRGPAAGSSSDVEELPAVPETDSPGPEQDVMTDDLIEALERRLDEREKLVLTLLRRGAATSQICQATGLSQPTVWRIRQRLARAFKDVLDS